MLEFCTGTLPTRLMLAVMAIACAAPVAAQAPAGTQPAPQAAQPAAQTAQPPQAAQPTPAPQPSSAPQPAPSPPAIATPAVPLQPTIALTPEATAVKKLLEEKFPNAQVRNVSKTGYFGLFEAQFDQQMIYTDAKVTYVIAGAIYDANSKQNLTEERARKLNRIAWDAMPLDLAMKKVKGTGQRKLIVFSDADCPFCSRLEKVLKDVDDVTIYTFLFPIDSLHPDSARKSKVIWCSADRIKAWDEFFSSGKLPENDGQCDNPVAATIALGQQLHVNATPTLVFADGSIIPGALPKDRLEAELTKADAEAKNLAASKK